ncbi:MAG: hypothetical protein ACLTYW_07760 [Collinsella sp.]
MFDLFVTPLRLGVRDRARDVVAVGPIFVWAENAILGLIQACSPCPSASVPLSSACSMPPRSLPVSTDVHRHRPGPARPVRRDLLAAHRQRCQHRPGAPRLQLPLRPTMPRSRAWRFLRLCPPSWALPSLPSLV